MLKEKIKSFLEVTGMPQTHFCKKAGISNGFLWYLLNEKKKASEETERRILEFMKEYKQNVMKGNF